ncbi:MAG: PDZ domain-containing protein [Acidobacteria bacterium]|nr:PDZ domain-containing protein [Acidobacteriota bacterium]
MTTRCVEGPFPTRASLTHGVRPLIALLWFLAMPALASAQALTPTPVQYRLSFSAPEHRLMEVAILFPDVPAGPLELRMSRSSPGRYALHEFAKNVFDVRVTDAGGDPLTVTRPDPYAWIVNGHAGTVWVTYRIFGDRIDGTYLAIDSTHAHINMPAALMWARGFDDRPVTIQFVAPGGADWRVGTQLLPGDEAGTFTAPNLQYLMDSPTEFSDFSLRTFTMEDAPASPVVRLVVHHAGTDADLDGFAADVERIVHEARHVFGEYPSFDGNTYTFIADYLPWANGDGMEHRNSTILTSASSIRTNREGLLDTAAHEFFHAWNVERIRPRSLEPFDFERANMSGELWLAEGFTSYYGPLIIHRAGLRDTGDYLAGLAANINRVRMSPGRDVRSAEEMSRFAPFVDAAAPIDRTSIDNTFISYYTWGAAIGLGLDLTLRDRTDGRITLDDYMRALWEAHGKPGGRAPGYVDRPYTMADLQRTLAAVSGDAGFADDFFARYIQGHEVVDYEPLLARAGLLLRRVSPGRAFAGLIRLQDAQGGARVADPVPFNSPAFLAGLERDDLILEVAGQGVTRAADFGQAIDGRAPGDEVSIVFERRGQRVTGILRLTERPEIEIVRAEDAGQTLTADQRQFRDSWLTSPGP